MRLAVAVSCSVAAAFVFCVAICLISARWRRQHFARQSDEADTKQAAAYKVAEPQNRGALGLQHLPSHLSIIREGGTSEFMDKSDTASTTPGTAAERR